MEKESTTIKISSGTPEEIQRCAMGLAYPPVQLKEYLVEPEPKMELEDLGEYMMNSPVWIDKHGARCFVWEDPLDGELCSEETLEMPLEIEVEGEDDFGEVYEVSEKVKFSGTEEEWWELAGEVALCYTRTVMQCRKCGNPVIDMNTCLFCLQWKPTEEDVRRMERKNAQSNRGDTKDTP